MMRLNRLNSMSRAFQFARVRAEGSSSVGRFFVVAAAPSNDGTSRLGVICTKKIGNAVIRNRVRRRAREIARTLWPTLSAPWHIVLIARWQAPAANFADITRDVRKNARKLGLLKQD